MTKQIGLIVLAGSLASAALATAQVPAPPAPPAAIAAPVAAPAPPLPPPAPPAPAVAATTIVPAAPPAPPTPAMAAPAVPQPPQVPPAPAKQAKPPRPPETARTPEPAKAPEAPEPPQPPPPGRERVEPDPVNIQFKVTVTTESAGSKPSKRVAILTVSNGTGMALERGMLRAGTNVPVASTSLVARTEDGKETPSAKPLTSYNYRSVGMNVDVQQAGIVANRIRASLSVEFSGVDEKTGPGSSGVPPSFPTFSQRVSLYLESGKPVLVGQSTDLATGVTQMVEVEAKILR